MPFRRPSPVLLVLYGCSAVGLGLAAVGVLVDGAIRFWWVGLVICAVSGIATQIVRWRSRRAEQHSRLDKQRTSQGDVSSSVLWLVIAGLISNGRAGAGSKRSAGPGHAP